MVSVSTAYYVERDRIVDEMHHSASKLYRDLLFSDYSDKNRSKINKMARKKVTSDEAKQQFSDQINESIEPSFDLQTAD